MRETSENQLDTSFPEGEDAGKIVLEPPGAAVLIVPILYILFVLMAANYLYWYARTAWVFVVGLGLVALGFGLHLARLFPNLTTRYEVSEEGIRVLGRRREEWIPWERVTGHLLREEWLTLKVEGKRKIRVRLSLFAKADQLAVKRLVREKLGGTVIPL